MTSGISIAKIAMGTHGGNTVYIPAGTYYAKIIGFDHNSAYEGTNKIHFALASVSTGTDIAFVENNGTYVLYNTQYSSAGTKGMLMHKRSTTASNANGWSGSYIRTWLNNTLLGNINSSWTNVMISATKYTDNVGNKSTAASSVTSTSDKLFIPAYYEVFGEISNCNAAEATKQEKYDYFKSNKKRYKHNATGTACIWWTRSVPTANNTNFKDVTADGSGAGANANYSYGVVPCFVVG